MLSLYEAILDGTISLPQMTFLPKNRDSRSRVHNFLRSAFEGMRTIWLQVRSKSTARYGVLY